MSEAKHATREDSIREKIKQLEAKIKTDTQLLKRLYFSLMWDDQTDPGRGDLPRPKSENLNLG